MTDISVTRLDKEAYKIFNKKGVKKDLKDLIELYKSANTLYIADLISNYEYNELCADIKNKQLSNTIFSIQLDCTDYIAYENSEEYGFIDDNVRESVTDVIATFLETFKNIDNIDLKQLCNMIVYNTHYTLIKDYTIDID